MGKGTKKFAIALATGIVAVAACAPTVTADQTNPTWNCRASVAYVKNELLPITGLIRVEPLVANGNADPNNTDRASCADDTRSVPHITIPNLELNTDEVEAETTINPALGAARDQTATSDANATNVDLNLGAAGALDIKVQTMMSHAQALCVGGVPTLTGNSQVVGLTINGTTLPVDAGLAQIAAALGPLAPLVKIGVNVQTISGDANSDSQTLTQQALTVQLLNTGNATALTAVLGETKVTRQGRTCDGTDLPGTPTAPANPANPLPGTNTGPTGPTNPSVVFVPIQVPVSTGTGSSKTTTVELNGTNGGCGTIKMFFDKNRQKTYNSVFGQRVVTRGRLVSCSGKSIIGGRVDVYHLIRGHKTRLRKTGVRSRAGGLVTLILPLNLTSRKIYFEYRGNLASSHVNSTSVLNLTVRDKSGKILTKLPPGQPKPHF